MLEPRLYTGMQPSSGSLHLGNYIGALKPARQMASQYDTYFAIADFHAITVPQAPGVLRDQVRTLAAQYLASATDDDADTSCLYVQSHVTAHTQLAWMLNTITGFGEASRMTQFKDKSAKNGANSTSVGLFTYPMLMAADILLFGTNVVPVGEDQTQHVQLTRDLAERFNKRYGDVFVIPEPVIVSNGARIYDLQNPQSKMSKSAPSEKGLISLLDTPEKIVKKFRSAVTDTETVVRADKENKPGVTNLLNILSSITGTGVAALEAEFDGQGYGVFKSAVADAVVAELEPIRKRTLELLADPAELDRKLESNAKHARRIADHTLEKAMRAMGLR